MTEPRQPVETVVEGGEWRVVLADAWVGWLRPMMILAAVALVAAAYVLDWFSEPVYARLLVAVYAAVVALGPAVQAALLAPRRVAVVPLVLGLLWAGVFVGPVWWTMAPGEPAAVASLHPGEEVSLEAAPASRLTVRIEGNVALAGDAKKDRELQYHLVAESAGAKEHIKGRFSRKKVGKRQRGLPGPDDRPVLVDAADLHALDAAKGEPFLLRLSRTKPATEQPLQVALYAGAVPWDLILVVLGAALLVAIPIAGRWMPRTQRTFLPHVGAIAFTFVLAGRGALDPIAPVKPLFGALLVALFAGVLFGEVVTFIVRRVMKPA